MHRTLIFATVVATGLLVCVSTMAAGAAAGAGCVEPVPQRNYGPDRAVYALVMDLGGCDWWDGGPIALEATLSRLDGSGETAATRIAVCGAFPRQTLTDPGDKSGTAPTSTNDAPTRTWSGLCDVFADLDHPSIEAALYRGEITYPWDGAIRTAGFAAMCGPGGGCVDLPADPSPALSAGSDVYEQLIGGAADE